MVQIKYTFLYTVHYENVLCIVGGLNPSVAPFSLIQSMTALNNSGDHVALMCPVLLCKLAPRIKRVSLSVAWRGVVCQRQHIEESIPEEEERMTFFFVVSNTEVISGGTMAESIDELLIQGIFLSLPH
jgi:hypothetical protein